MCDKQDKDTGIYYYNYYSFLRYSAALETDSYT
jgi:hypothetical protein